MRATFGLTPDQIEAVRSEDRVNLVLAPAGSGKTEVIIRRIIRLLDETQGESFHVLAVTYTRKAAEELRERVRVGVGAEQWRVDANTIHAFALDWLRRFGQPVGITRDVVVYSDTADRMVVLRDYFNSFGADIDEAGLAEILSRIDSYKSDVQHDPITAVGLPLYEVREAYFQALEAQGGIDFTAMLDKMGELLEVDPSVKKRFQRLYKHVLVDEGQDLTEPQSRLIRDLVGEALGLFVVADDRQSINRWAGGGIEWARALVGPTSTELHLVNNFRCATEILDVARSIASHFLEPRADAKPVSGAPPGRVQLSVAPDETEQAKFVAQWISKLLESGLDPESLVEGESNRVQPEDIAVIARTRFRLDAVRNELRSRSIETAILSDIREMLDTSEGRLFHALLAARINKSDRPALRRAAEELQSMFSGTLPDATDPALFLDSLRQLTSSTPLEEMVELVTSVSTPIDFERALAEVSKSTDDEHVANDYLQLQDWWAAYRASSREQDRSLTEFLVYLAQLHQARPHDPGVRMLTTHRSKGLEFRAVAVIGLTQGGFPDYRNIHSPTELDQERRAFYVAVTRASRSLLLTWPMTSVTRFGSVRTNDPSQFLREINMEEGKGIGL